MPFIPGRPGHFVRLSPEALAACVSSIRPTNNAKGTMSLLVRRVISLNDGSAGKRRLRRGTTCPFKGGSAPWTSQAVGRSLRFRGCLC